MSAKRSAARAAPAAKAAERSEAEAPPADAQDASELFRSGLERLRALVLAQLIEVLERRGPEPPAPRRKPAKTSARAAAAKAGSGSGADTDVDAPAPTGSPPGSPLAPPAYLSAAIRFLKDNSAAMAEDEDAAALSAVMAELAAADFEAQDGEAGDDEMEDEWDDAGRRGWD
ncbi:MAG: hypothetical protein AAGM38_13940 [Pseudomonadota bacterium]